MLRLHCHVQVHKLCLKQLSCNIHIDLNKKQHPLELCNIKPIILRVIQEEFFQMYFSLYSIQIVLKSVYCRSDHFWFLIHATNVKSSLPQIFFSLEESYLHPPMELLSFCACLSDTGLEKGLWSVEIQAGGK